MAYYSFYCLARAASQPAQRASYVHVACSASLAELHRGGRGKSKMDYELALIKIKGRPQQLRTECEEGNNALPEMHESPFIKRWNPRRAAPLCQRRPGAAVSIKKKDRFDAHAASAFFSSCSFLTFSRTRSELAGCTLNCHIKRRRSRSRGSSGCHGLAMCSLELSLLRS